MATRLDYRNKLKDKILGLEDEGYGDFEFSDPEYDTYLELALAQLYPALYKRESQPGLVAEGYGTARYTKVETPFSDRVFLVEDAMELEPLLGWQVRPDSIIHLDTLGRSGTVNLYYYDAYVMPDDDETDAGIPAIWTPLIILGALIGALESRHDTGLRGDPAPVGPHHEVTLLDRLVSRYETLKAEMAMTLPAVRL